VLTPNTPATVPIDGGPRHMSFTPDERFAYLLTQGESTIVSFTYDKATGGSRLSRP
jgi:6-phosphogluconolactonase (cycloisomerase 2 family)